MTQNKLLFNKINELLHTDIELDCGTLRIYLDYMIE